jgi:hypothetical protein
MVSFDCHHLNGFILSHSNTNQNDLQQTISHPILDQPTPALTVQPFRRTEKAATPNYMRVCKNLKLAIVNMMLYLL